MVFYNFPTLSFMESGSSLRKDGTISHSSEFLLKRSDREVTHWVCEDLACICSVATVTSGHLFGQPLSSDENGRVGPVAPSFLLRVVVEPETGIVAVRADYSPVLEG